jgi:hypothetical protein
MGSSLPIRLAVKLEIGLVNEFRGRQGHGVGTTKVVARHPFQLRVDAPIQLWIGRRLIVLREAHNRV